MGIRTSGKCNEVWRRFMNTRSVTSVPDPRVRRSDRFFLMGSCFAEEIRLALEAEIGPSQVGPDYLRARYDRKSAEVDELPKRNHLNTYNTFSMLQEIERILGLWKPEPDDAWQVGDRLQCPYRRLVFAKNLETFVNLNAELDRVLREGFEEADHFIFTLGLTETFVNVRSGKVANQQPGYAKGGGAAETAFRPTGYADNLAAALRIVDLIREAKPDAQLFMTVSPVPLQRTFSGQDVFVANSYSKSVLRAVLGEVVATRPGVVYFPSYEAVISTGNDAWEEDGRHVRRPVVEGITRTFVETYFAD